MSSPADQTETPFDYEAHSEQATDALGAMLASAAEPGLVVGLIGPLGAGKTRLVRATATALGADPSSVSSPTFVLIQEYFGRIPVYHFDTYRLATAREFAELGVDEYFTGDGVCLIEWADKVTDVLPAERLTISLTITGPTTRMIEVTAHGSRFDSIMQALH